MLKYNFESNSQQCREDNEPVFVGNYMLKYNFESNSQHSAVSFLPCSGWELYAKVQF